MTPALHPSHAPHSVPALQAFPDRLNVVTVIYNPYRFRSRYRLYRAFAKQMQESGVNLLTVEIALGERPFEITSPHDPWNLQLRTHAELWHKERAINLGLARVKQIVPGAKYFAWIDADILFTRSDWAQETLQMLQHHPVIQPYGMAANLDPNDHIQWTVRSCFRAALDRQTAALHKTSDSSPDGSNNAGHPGLAWAATREFLEATGGLLETCISGSADSYMANALKGEWTKGDHINPDGLEGFSLGYAESIRQWAEKVEPLHQNIGYAAGTVLHYWHGKPSERGYPLRWNILKQHQFNPSVDLEVEESGLYRFAGNKPAMERDLRRTMIGRNEDSIDA